MFNFIMCGGGGGGYGNRGEMTLRWLVWITTISLCWQSSAGMSGKNQLCEVETGQTNIILDIEESRGNSIGQRTTPTELPIYGDPFTEIALELVFPKGNPLFLLNGKTLELLQPLDRDKENLSHIVFQISCTNRASRRKRNIPIIVRVSDVNDNAPVFLNSPYETSVPESTPIDTTVFRNLLAEDIDAGVNGLVEYFLIEGNRGITNEDKLTSADGYGTFAISFPHQGQVTLVKSLDYERIQKYYLTIVASDRARNVSERLSATTTLIINVEDSDDLDPSFIYGGCVLLDGACINPEYTTSVPAGTLEGVLSVKPERIQAVDLDTISAPIHYSFESGQPPNYRDYFEIDKLTGVLKHIKIVDANVANRFDIVVKAEEDSEAKRFTTAKLTIHVKKVDANPPVIAATAVESFVDENSAIGTNVVDKNGDTIQFSTTDADLTETDPKPAYIYELTTPSFQITRDGMLIVNEEGLDRDPPSPGRFRFQVVAREPITNAASSPLTITVILKDVNDNPPKLPIHDPVSIQAGEGRRVVTQVTAHDNDEGPNAQAIYSIYHVSNNGQNKFTINDRTGEIETRGKLSAGEQYSITVQATDIGSLYSQTIIEVTVTPGPNTKPPKFVQPVYEVQISEGAEINSTVISVKAEDPENDPIRYSISSGDDLKQFNINENGLISVSRKLDREDFSRYLLTIRAEDTGGLYSSATVNVKVTDINDKNPEFDDKIKPYLFHVDEGKENAHVGNVQANDDDEGINSEISYFLPDDIPFKINETSGEIRTRSKLDYETQSSYKFVVTARDNALDPRLGTTTVTVKVNDVPDEVPKFLDGSIDVEVPENVPDFLLTTVVAHDPDTIKGITYTILRGPADLFKVDAKTGQVRTLRNLDYEKERNHELIIGTLENNGTELGDTIKISIKVLDRNDIPPMFLTIPAPVTINSDQPIGTGVATMPAVDTDGSYPNNVVRYEIVGEGKALKYFQIDQETGIIKIKDDLNKEEDSEYQIDVRAYDLGDPQLSNIASLPVFIRHLKTNPNNNLFPEDEENVGVGLAEFGLAFSDDSYTVSIPENAGVNSTIKLIQIINSVKPAKQNSDLNCEIFKGNDHHIFTASLKDNACVVGLVKPLDYELKNSHELEIRLFSNSHQVNPNRNIAKLHIIVQDTNDNAPEFVFKNTYVRRGKNDTYYTVISPDADLDTTVLQVKATDKDSGKFGTIKYIIFDKEMDDLSDDDPASTYFSITEDTGIIKVHKSLKSVRDTPLIFYIEAVDNNGEPDDRLSLKAEARVVVNLINDANRLALAFSDASPKDIRGYYSEIEELLFEKSHNYIIGIERFSNRKFVNSEGVIEENPMATDIWFYIIDPTNEQILKSDSDFVQSKFLEQTIQSDINYEASSIARATAQGIYAPVAAIDQIHKVKTAVIIKNSNGEIGYTLIIVALLILVFGVIGIIYICISWSRYKNFKQRMRQYTASGGTATMPKRYDPVIINGPGSQHSDTQSHLKEYETQVLAMAVNQDEGDDLQLDFSAKNHAFNLDNVSYITRKENGQRSPTNSEATTAALSTLRRNNNNTQNTYNRTIEIIKNNPHKAMNGNLSGTLTLGRVKPDNNIYQNSNFVRNERLESAFSTLGRNHHHQHPTSSHSEFSNNSGTRPHFNAPEVPSPNYYPRGHNHTSACNDNVTFGRRDYNQLDFLYLNDLDRSEAETTTEL